MKYIHIISSILATLVCLAGLTACIKEDMEDCPEDLRIYLTFTPATYARTGVDPKEVDRISLFAFDVQGIFRGVWIDENPALAPGYYMTIPRLPAGDYRFVVWGGLHECYSTLPATFKVGETLYKDALLELDITSGEISKLLHPLFHAQKTEYIREDVRQQHIDMPIVQAYNTINLTTEGLAPTSDEFRMSVTDNNGKYTFDYSFAPCSEFIYSALCTKDAGGQLRSSLNILKLAADRHPQFGIYNVTQQKTLYKADLVDLLNKMEDVDYDNIHTYDVHITFTTDGTDLYASVSINGWEVTEETEILY